MTEIELTEIANKILDDCEAHTVAIVINGDVKVCVSTRETLDDIIA